MGFTFNEIIFGENIFHSSYTAFDYLIQDIIRGELEMHWFNRIVIYKDDYQELLEKLEEWMQSPRSEEFFQNHQYLDRKYVQMFIDFLNEVDCFGQEEC